MKSTTTLSLVATLSLFTACGEDDEIAALEERIAALEDAVAQHTADIAGNRGAIAGVEAKTAPLFVQNIDGVPSVVFEGVNVHIVDGSGDTACGTESFEDCNGSGNLIVGYNELRAEDNYRTGSHNLVVGTEHNFWGHGGLVTGAANEISGGYAAVLGGTSNFARSFGVVVGGYDNEASGWLTTIVGAHDILAPTEGQYVDGDTCEGPPCVSGYEIVQVGNTIEMAPGDNGVFVSAYCPSGKKILGGGYSSGGFFTFMNSSPVGDQGWQVLVVNRHTTTFSAPVTVRAICAVVEE
ncbi:MAG: hypothetical protein JRI25_18855 [Deltaproteobacteria bacterium]|nr:hypothetical protein [Deltaproteobacteria bacterium]MBW2256637.1 hypothetical protein [Deltaproteobacteria bacterium]